MITMSGQVMVLVVEEFGEWGKRYIIEYLILYIDEF